MSKITPHLWFDTQAKEAAEFYSEVFPRSQVTNVTTLRDTPSGDCDVVSFTVWDCDFMAISAGPLFEINPSISFFVNFDTGTVPDAATTLDRIWAQLADGGNELMALGEYPFSKRYGWIADRYGVSWQLILSDAEGDPRPAIVPSLLFTGDVCGKAAEARDCSAMPSADSQPRTPRARSPTNPARRCSPTSASPTLGWRRWTAPRTTVSVSTRRCR
jgi:predicted 3-demethylubiquinone-9 3-methyltransferase (glyoxalase superfamily)